jgi:hypothetical protein
MLIFFFVIKAWGILKELEFHIHVNQEKNPTYFLIVHQYFMLAVSHVG